MSEMNEEEIKQMIAAKEAELKEQHERDKAAMIAELQAEREEKRLLKEKLEKKGEQDDPDLEDPEKVVEKILTRKQEEEAARNKEIAIQEFKRKHPEFSDETDPAGIAFRKFESELGKFNLSGLKTKEDFDNRLKEVHEFMNRGKTRSNEQPDFYKGNPPTNGSDPAEESNAGLNASEAKLMNELGWSKDKFLQMKSKRPGYVASLLSLRN